MAKSKTVFRCQQCGFESVKWNGKCPSCGTWNSLIEETVQPTASGNVSARKKTDLSDFIQALEAVSTKEDIRYHTGIGELDRVLGGGLVKGSIVLLGGEPGIGKSTLLLQICEFLGASHSVLYVSGEESTKQIKLRAERLHVTTESLYLLANNDAQSICDTIAACEPEIVIIDSIQTMQLPELSSSPGSLTQVRECTNLFMHTAKQYEIPIFIVGHVNKDGAIAGPKVMEHIVDTVLYFEGDRKYSYRILRAVKNRFGSTNEIGVFEMLEQGLQEVLNPSAMLLEDRPINVSGTCVTCVMEGSRPILAEVQVLVTKSSLPSPRRMANGFDFNRVAIILAILEKRCGLFYGTLDVYLNVVGGFRLDEPSGDLAVALCLYSSLRDKAIDEHVAAFGELGLGGEVRSISNLTQRIREAERMGFTTCIIPRQSMRALTDFSFQIQLIGVRTLKEAFDFLEK
ncbi:MAG: DNA repair protein RadA [Oscillospiraceae bacterium]|nr:DNA repair protein RadA [Oscillospiraceae bacterium]